jgi:quinolinate synthase
MNYKWKQLRGKLGKKLLILAHYYQNNEIFDLADETGDSYRLAKIAHESDAEYTIFCGVHFMAESAAILAGEGCKVFLPVHEASCALAETMDNKPVKDIIKIMENRLGTIPVPMVYVNSSAEIKALAGQNGGTACTSSNASKIMESILRKKQKVFFMPDKNLGINTALKLGIKPEEMTIISESSSNEISSNTKIFIWDGYCYVHNIYSLADIERARAAFPSGKIIVHPESPPEVVAQADYAGSTSGLLEQFRVAKPGTVLVVGTEWNFVERLKRFRDDVQIEHLRPSICADMHRIKSDHLYKLVNQITEGNTEEGHITVSEDIAGYAKAALSRMIEYTESKE